MTTQTHGTFAYCVETIDDGEWIEYRRFKRLGDAVRYANSHRGVWRIVRLR